MGDAKNKSKVISIILVIGLFVIICFNVHSCLFKSETDYEFYDPDNSSHVAEVKAATKQILDESLNTVYDINKNKNWEIQVNDLTVSVKSQLEINGLYSDFSVSYKYTDDTRAEILPIYVIVNGISVL